MRAFKHLFSAFLFTIFWSTLHSLQTLNAQSASIDYLIVAGGGGGASGGGGAGGVVQATNYSIPANSNITIVVGAGGSAGSGGAGNSGANIGAVSYTHLTLPTTPYV